MAEETQTTSQEQSTSQTEGAVSLEDVYKQFNVEAEAQNFRPQRTEQQQSQQSTTQPNVIPDPITNPDGHRAWLAAQSDSVNKALTQVTGQLSQMQAERAQAKGEAAVHEAVQKFKSVMGEDVDDLTAEVALSVQARKDPKFLSVFNNRDKNPGAWNAAVSAFARDYKSKNQLRTDPQLAENQRAAKASIGSQTKAPANADENDIFAGAKTPAEVNSRWRNFVDRGY